jgi:hypothetical protein
MKNPTAWMAVMTTNEMPMAPAADVPSPLTKNVSLRL